MIPKPGSVKKINKIDEILVRNIKEKRYKLAMSGIKEEISPGSSDI